MDAILIAGGIPKEGDPLFDLTRGKPKAMLEIAGKPMVQWVLDALGQARQVENVILIGLPEDTPLRCSKPIHHLPNQGSMLANIVAGVHKVLELNPESEYVLSVSSDIPALSGEMVDWLIDTAMQTRHDIYYGIVRRETMEQRFPGSNRTYTRLADMEVCGADIHIAHVSMATDPEHLAMWEELIGRRKSPLKQAAKIGFDTLLLLLLRRLTLEDAIRRVCKRLRITGRAIIWPYAEAAMDVDKPHQYEILRADLEARLAA